jgi:hypothetical protein
MRMRAWRYATAPRAPTLLHRGLFAARQHGVFMILENRRRALLTLSSLWLAACGGGGTDTAETDAAQPGAAGTDPMMSAERSRWPRPVPPPPPAPPPPAPGAHYADFHGASLGAGAALNGALAFPSGNAWNTDVSKAPIDPNSDTLIASIGLTTGLHPDFGAGLYNGAPIGIPYIVVAGTQARVAMNFVAYADESDPGPYPVPANAPIEGAPDTSGDRHVIVIDKDNNRLYELYRAFANSNGSWNADCGAVFHLDSNTVRPGGQPGWTSADAAGLPIFPGLARYEEAKLGPGGIRHALRFTVQRSRKAYVPPAAHSASSSTSTGLPPMGMRVRLKASYVIPSTFSAETRALLTAMKTYGMIVADNGSNWFVSGAPDNRWNNDALTSELAQVKGSNFEVLRMDGLVVG